MTMAVSRLLLLAPALCLATESAVPQAISVQLGSKAVLDCGEEADRWMFNETIISADEDDGLYTFEDEGRKLVVSEILEANLGVYKCVGEDNEVIREFEVDASFKLRNLPKSISVDDGSPVLIECKAKVPVEDVVFQWFTLPESWETDPAQLRKELCAKGSKCSSDDLQAEALFDTRDKALPVAALEERAQVKEEVDEEGIPVSRLTISPAYTEDRQVYVCQAVLAGESVEECGERNKHCDEEMVLLRVKDPLAALYPFVGIVAEVIVLCIVIFFCEKSKSEDKEDYEVVTGNGNPASSSSANLRQRK